MTNNPNVPNNIGPGRNLFRRLVPFGVYDGVIVPFSNVGETTSTAFLTYHGLQLRAEKRLSHGLTFLTSYTWSKAISNAAPYLARGDNATFPYQDLFNGKLERGLADHDHRHRFVTAAAYDLPFGGGRRFGANASRFVDKIIGGWALNGIMTLQSGYPLTVRRQGDPGGVGLTGALRPDLVCNPDLPRGQQTVEKFFATECFVAPESLVPGDLRPGTAPRGAVQGPGIIGTDLSATKTTTLFEQLRLEFRAEFFNTFNHAVFGVPNRDLGNANFGRVTSTNDPRIVQFGLKLLF